MAWLVSAEFKISNALRSAVVTNSLRTKVIGLTVLSMLHPLGDSDFSAACAGSGGRTKVSVLDSGCLTVRFLASTSLRAPHRDRERERRTRTQLALHPNLAPVQLGELATQRQPQPGAFHLLRRRPHLAELLEHLVLILESNTNPS